MTITGWYSMDKKYMLKDLINILDFDELLKVKKDLEKNSIHLKRLIDRKIEEKKNIHSRHCSYCSGPINPYNRENFTLLFGPEDFKKKATFCGMDCLKAFMLEIEEIKKSRLKNIENNKEF